MTIVLAFSGGNITVNDQLHIRQILGDLTDYVVLQNQETIKPNGVNITPSGCESQESCVTSQQTADSFFVRY